MIRDVGRGGAPGVQQRDGNGRASSLVFPMFGMVLLTAAVLVVVFRSRVRAQRAGALSASFFRTFQGGLEPDLPVSWPAT